MEMKGYDRAEAVAFMLGRLNTAEFKPLAAQADTLINQAIDADLAYMLSAGVLEKDGTMGGAYYDDDDAFEFMLDEIGKKRRSNDRELDMIASFIDQYMDLQQAYLEDKGLMSWD